jgi:hypothetical protein
MHLCSLVVGHPGPLEFGAHLLRASGWYGQCTTTAAASGCIPQMTRALQERPLKLATVQAVHPRLER